MGKTLAILTVNYEQVGPTVDFLRSLENQTNMDYVVFLSDLSRKPADFTHGTRLEVIRGENKGYAYGINLALHSARRQNFDAFAVMNNDTVTSPNFVEASLHSLSRHPAHLIGGKIYYASGHEFHKDLYHKQDLGRVLWYAGGKIDWNNVHVKHRGVDEVDHGQYDTVQPTDFVSGCLMLFDNTVVNKIGFWDENYFLYYEDADYCVRAGKNGIGLLYDPSVVIWHLNAASTGGSGSLLHQNFQNANRIRFGLKYAPLKTKLHLLKNRFIR